ncbi:hypothetical protein K503DRAFT_794912 [Rhizopogon vinicolor AM-OR11-026]|uniref:Uncharacterized protein n=1 Tax=Rhizopogon vinicolor AM-OR11-026 TaxID=1314800 RepID=A0A1B7MGE0_9AGAM|nr:hypothetical protein K503DRAFT_794912 [Rhizopogon vinicolor AM-OR11-026]
MAHGVEPLLPFDITEATFMLPDISALLSTDELIALRTHQLAKRDEDLATVHQRVLTSRYSSVRNFEKRFTNTIHDYNFSTGTLVLVLNKKVEPASNAKCKPRYFGPMVLKFAPFRLIPYHLRSLSSLNVTRFLNPNDLAGTTPQDD